MKKNNKYFCLFLLLTGSIQVNAKEESLSIGNHSQQSMTELDIAFVSAVKSHDLEKMEELIQAGANIHTPIPYVQTLGDCDWDIETTALTYAVRNNSPDMVRILIKKEKIFNKLLNEAIRYGYLSVVEELIKAGADVNYLDENKNTPLIIAVEHARATAEFNTQAQERARSRWSQRRAIIQMLLEAGANVNHINKYGKTALMKAVEGHDLNTVEKLLEIPAVTTGSFFGFGTKPINYADQNGNTALILAIKNVRYTYINSQEYNICANSQKIINILLETPGIDPYYANKEGETAIVLLEELNKKMSRYPY